MPLETLAKLVTPLGDSLLLQSMTGREELGRLFHYELSVLSESSTVKASDLLGQNITVELELPDGHVRYWNGVVTRFARGAGHRRLAQYRLTMRPWLWLLSRTADCRIFQNVSIPEVVKQVFRDLGLTDFDDALSGTYRTWDYIVQYRETALDFVSRLMEREGIYHYFRHESGKHTLVFSDSYGAHATTAGYGEVPYYSPGHMQRRERDHLDRWTASEQIQPGAYLLNDFDFTRPKASLQSKAKDPRDHARAEMEYYDYPGGFVEASDGETYAKTYLQARMAEYEQLEGSGNARGLCAGSLFSLTGFPADDLNREYLVVATNYAVTNNLRESDAHGEVSVHVDVSAIESRTQYRAAQLTPRPIISGPQTAIVVGKAGEDIWTDQYGRVKVQFHWDRLGKADENSSCWVRVAQIWAGGRWGSAHIPRIGQEVIVEFLEGDPDRPLITGRVYNGDNKPPYDLPANQTQSGIKSRSSKGGNPDNFNELRFEDKKGAEQVYLQAEKDFTVYVKHDESRKIDNNHFKEVVKNETTKIGIDRTETVGGDEKLEIKQNRVETVFLDETLKVVGNRFDTVVQNENISIGGNSITKIGSSMSLNVAATKTEMVAVASALTIGAGYQVTVGGAMNESVGGLKAEEVAAAKTVLVGGVSSEAIGGNKSVTAGGSISHKAVKNFAVDATQDVTTSSGKKTTLSAKGDFTIDGKKKALIQVEDELTLRVGKATITLKKNGDIQIKGAKINVTGSGDVTVKGSKITNN